MSRPNISVCRRLFPPGNQSTDYTSGMPNTSPIACEVTALTCFSWSAVDPNPKKYVTFFVLIDEGKRRSLAKLQGERKRKLIGGERDETVLIQCGTHPPSMQSARKRIGSVKNGSINRSNNSFLNSSAGERRKQMLIYAIQTGSRMRSNNSS